MLVREKGFNEWIEREFAWRVTLKDKTVRVISLAAIHFMPFHELPPLPHQDQISGDSYEVSVGRAIWMMPFSTRVRETGHSPLRCGIFQAMSRAYVEFPSVPGAFDDFSFKRSLPRAGRLREGTCCPRPGFPRPR